MKQIRLTKEEQEIEDTADQYVPASKETRERVERIIERSNRLLTKSRRDESTNENSHDRQSAGEMKHHDGRVRSAA